MTNSGNKKLQGKVAIVTGGASGIGEATARCFADHGAIAVVIADVQEEKGKNLAASIGLHRSTYIHCDVTDENQVEALVESTVRNYGRIDIMFSNAGVPSASAQTILDFDLSAYEKLFAVNVRGMAACVKHAARAMVDGGVRGSIICTASKAASIPGSDVHTDYVTSKCAVVGLMRSASLQLGAHGIRVNSVSPGLVATPMSSGVLNMGPEEMKKAGEGASYLKNGKVLTAEHIAEAVAFLGSEESEFITGHDLAVDGGFVYATTGLIGFQVNRSNGSAVE